MGSVRPCDARAARTSAGTLAPAPNSDSASMADAAAATKPAADARLPVTGGSTPDATTGGAGAP
eukprot:2549834-Pyramimonas_sp.AAC.1